MNLETKEIWDTYALDVKRFIFKKTKNKDLSNDLLQETFIKIHTKKSTLKDSKKLKSWLFSVANNTVLDYFRNHQKNNFYALNNTNIIDEISNNKEHHSFHDCLNGIIKNLPKKYREPLFKYDIKGIKQNEIAKELNLPLPTIKSQIQRARKMIKKGYMDCCGFEVNNKGFLIGDTKNKEDCKVCD